MERWVDELDGRANLCNLFTYAPSDGISDIRYVAYGAGNDASTEIAYEYLRGFMEDPTIRASTGAILNLFWRSLPAPSSTMSEMQRPHVQLAPLPDASSEAEVSRIENGDDDLYVKRTILRIADNLIWLEMHRGRMFLAWGE